MKTVSAYSYGVWCKRYNLPFLESIRSTLPLVREYHIVTDRRFDDGTLETLQREAERSEGKLIIHEESMDLDDPGVDGKTKALGRSYCKGDLCLQMDLDEIIYQNDYVAFMGMFEKFPEDVPILGTGVINWHEGMLKYSAAGWVKERVSWNDPGITHGIPYGLRRDRGDGYFYAEPESTDGAGYIDAQGRGLGAKWYQCNWKKFPRDFLNPESIWIGHYSWFFVRRKWQMNHTWDYFWMNLFGTIKGLREYSINRDGEPVDFWRPRALPPLEGCLEALENEMKDRTVKPVPDFIYHPDGMSDWLQSIELYDPGKLWRLKRGIWHGRIKR